MQVQKSKWVLVVVVALLMLNFAKKYEKKALKTALKLLEKRRKQRRGRT